MPAFAGRLRFHFWQDIPTPALVEKVAALGPGTILFLNNAIPGLDGRMLDFGPSAALIRANARCPLGWAGPSIHDLDDDGVPDATERLVNLARACLLGERHLALARAQALAGHVDGDQARGARGVEGHALAAQLQLEGDLGGGVLGGGQALHLGGVGVVGVAFERRLKGAHRGQPSRGGRQFGLFTDSEELPSCSSIYGLCEA